VEVVFTIMLWVRGTSETKWGNGRELPKSSVEVVFRISTYIVHFAEEGRLQLLARQAGQNEAMA